MPLHLITGRANAGKTGVLNARLLASLQRGESPVLVLPGVADTRRAMTEFAEKAPVGLAVVTFRRWADGLWRLHGDGRCIIGDASRDAFVRRAIGDTISSALATIAGTPGFSAMIARTVRGIEGRPGGGSTEAMRGVARICSHYVDLITEAGLIETAEAWRALGADPPILGGAIAVNRFIEMDEPMVSLLKGLSLKNDVVVALTWEKDFAPTCALNSIVEEFQELAETVTAVPDAESSGELGAILETLYTGSAGVKTKGAVRMGLAAGTDAEAALVARFAGEAVAAGTPPDRIVVAFPDLGGVAHRVGNAFSAEGLSYEIDIARPVSATAFGRSLDGLLMLALGEGDRTTAMGVLLGPHCDIAPEAVADLDREWRESRVGEPRRLLDDICKREGSLLAEAASVARSLAGQALGPQTGSKWQSLVGLLISAAAERVATGGRTSVRELAERLDGDTGAAQVVVRAVGEMASVDGATFSAGDVRAALRKIVTGGTAGERPGRVQITELARLRSRRFDTVIIGGLTSAEMPVANSDSLADELRETFAPGAAGDTDDHARLAFYQAISRARADLVLVRRGSDDSGAPIRGSVLWEEIVDVYRAPGESADAWPEAGPPCVRMGAADIAAAAPVFSQGRRALRREAMAGLCVLGAPDRGVLSDQSVLERLSRTDVFSATEIETYLQCPYRWFYERVVRPEEIDVEVDARAVGTIAHGLLKAFYDRLPKELGTPRVTPENVEQATRLLERIIAESNTGITPEGLSERLDLERAHRWVAAAIADDAYVLPAFVPTEHEFAFGGEGEASVSLGGARFRGRIDRIDQSPEAVFVTDYKSARQVSGHAKFADDAKIQAVVYALIAREAFGLPVAGSVYRSLRSRRMRGFWRGDLLHGALAFGDEDDSIDEADLDALIAGTADRIEAAVAGIREGRVPRRPVAKNACVFCGLKAQCEGAT